MKQPKKIILPATDIIAAKMNRDHTLKIALRAFHWVYKFNMLKCVECKVIPSIETVRTRKRKRGPFVERVTKKSLGVVLRFESLPNSTGDYGTATLLPSALKRQKAKKAAS